MTLAKPQRPSDRPPERSFAVIPNASKDRWLLHCHQDWMKMQTRRDTHQPSEQIRKGFPRKEWRSDTRSHTISSKLQGKAQKVCELTMQAKKDPTTKNKIYRHLSAWKLGTLRGACSGTVWVGRHLKRGCGGRDIPSGVKEEGEKDET